MASFESGRIVLLCLTWARSGRTGNDYEARRETEAVKATIGAKMEETAALGPVETQRATMSQSTGCVVMHPCLPSPVW
jgi:hypothetical protein